MNYKLFGKSGLRVSEICLGTMTFGEEWGYGANKEESQKIFNTFLEAGGNFLDTANRYTEGTSEKYLGEFVKESGRREELVIATKYSLATKVGRINDSGNHRKNLVQTLDGSLKRLGLDYVDVLYVHAWDFTTPIEEVLRPLDDMLRSGKVLHIAISDTPAWIISRSDAIAELRGWTAFAGIQIEYSLITRDAERELLSMANELGLAVTAWAPLAGGALTGKYLNKNDDPKRIKEGSKRINERSTAIAAEVVKIAEELNCSPGNVALQWVMRQKGVIIPVVGARNETQLKDNLKCLEVKLSEEQINRLDEISKIELGFPHEFLTQQGVKQVLYGGFIDRIENHRKK